MSEPRSFTFLVNPASGGGAAPGAVLPVSRLLRDAGARVDVTYSPGPQAMADLVAAAVARGDVVVSVGGDGMLSSLAGSVSLAGGVLGVLPAGRGNDFARMLGLPDGAEEQAGVLLSGLERRVDLIQWTLPGAAPRRVAGSVYCGVGEYAASNVVVANSGYYGKGMKIAPAAVLDDGLLDVVVIEAASKLSLMRSLPTVYDGAHVDLPQVTVLRGRRVEVAADPTARGAAGVPVGGDGEPLGALPGRAGAPALVEVLPGALSVLAP